MRSDNNKKIDNAAQEAMIRLGNARKAQKVGKDTDTKETAKGRGVSPDGGQVQGGGTDSKALAFQTMQLGKINPKGVENLYHAIEAKGLLPTEGPEAANTDKELGKIINLNTNNVGGIEDKVDIGNGPEAVIRQSEEDQNIVNFYAKRQEIQEKQQKKEFIQRIYDASQNQEGEGPAGSSAA